MDSTYSANRGIFYGRQITTPQDSIALSQSMEGTKFQKEQAGAQRQFEAGQAEAQRASQERQAQMAANASMYPYQLKENRFNQLFPYLQQQYAGLGGKMATAGGQSPPSPEIGVGPIWNDQQIQQKVNTATAAGDQSTATKIKAMQSGLGGRGLGANSPLAMALGGQMQSANLASNTANERETRLGAAGDNAQHVLQAQQAREQQFASRQQEDIARRKPYFDMQNALLAAITGLV